MPNEIKLNDLLECFSKLRDKGYVDLNFVLYEDLSGSFRNRTGVNVINFDDIDHLVKILTNMDILKN